MRGFQKSRFQGIKKINTLISTEETEKLQKDYRENAFDTGIILHCLKAHKP